MANNTNKPANTAENKNEKVNTNKPANTAENKNEKVNTNKPANTKVVAIPVDPLNKKNDKIKVVINGKETIIKRGVQQTVSTDVYERLVIAGYVIEG